MWAMFCNAVSWVASTFARGLTGRRPKVIDLAAPEWEGGQTIGINPEFVAEMRPDPDNGEVTLIREKGRDRPFAVVGKYADVKERLGL